MSDRETCPDCGLPVANDEEWRVIPEGKGDWLCWERDGCGQGEELVARLRSALADAERERDEAKRALLLADDLIKTAYGESGSPSSSMAGGVYWGLRRAMLRKGGRK